MAEQSVFREWFADWQIASTMAVEEISLARGTEWRYRESHVGREDNAFYRGILVKVRTDDRSWEQFMLQSTLKKRCHGVIILVGHGDKFLVQAKPEPGNNTPGNVVLTATLQASYANLHRSDLPFATLLLDPHLKTVDAPQDGGLLFGKFNRFGYIERDIDPARIPPTHRWATMNDIYALAKEEMVSEFLLQALGWYHILRSR